MEGMHTDPNPAPGIGGAGDPDDYRQVEKAFEAAKKLRLNWEGLWQDIFDYVMPERKGFEDSHSMSIIDEGESRGATIFDETAMVENPRFVSRIVNGMFPQGNRAFRLKPHPAFRDRGGRLQQELDGITDSLHESLRNSNFHTELYEGITDLSVSTMTMMVMPGQLPGEFQFTAMPMTQIYILPGPFGGPDSWFRRRKVKLRDITRIWRNAQLSDEMQQAVRADADKETFMVEYTTRVRDITTEEKYRTRVACFEYKHIVHDEQVEGTGSNPFITTRWMADAGETYGRGPLVQVLPAIKTSNLTVEMILEAGQWALGGAFTYDDDGVFNFDNVTIEPGVFIPRSPGSKIEALGSSSDFNVSQLILEDMRNNIRRALFSSAPDRPQGKTPPSALEIAEDRAETARNQGGAVARIQYEFLVPLVKRLIYIANRQGAQFPQIDGRNILMVPESPLVRSQDQEDIANLMRYGESLQFLMGPEVAAGAQIPQTLIPWLAERYRISGELVPNRDEIEERLQLAAQVGEQQLTNGAAQ
jgi:hypothetical protein